MDENNYIRKAWHELDKLCGPDYPGRNAAFRKAAQAYSNAILDADDKDRINCIGKKHLKLVSNGLLDDKQFRIFLTNVISYERYLHTREE